MNLNKWFRDFLNSSNGFWSVEITNSIQFSDDDTEKTRIYEKWIPNGNIW